MRKTNHAKRAMRKIAKANPNVDERVVAESMDFVDFVRRIGGKHTFGILPSSESTLKLKPPTLHMFD